jgi:hypothetical protein
VIARTFDPGWLARIEDGSELPVFPVDGGFQAVRLEGSGVERVHMRYRPARFGLWTAITFIATAVDIGLVLALAYPRRTRSLTA